VVKQQNNAEQQS